MTLIVGPQSTCYILHMSTRYRCGLLLSYSAVIIMIDYGKRVILTHSHSCSNVASFAQ